MGHYQKFLSAWRDSWLCLLGRREGGWRSLVVEKGFLCFGKAARLAALCVSGARGFLVLFCFDFALLGFPWKGG